MQANQFSVRVKPFVGESLWSFLLRLSYKNGISVLALLNSIRTWQSKYIQKSDRNLLDFFPGNMVNLDTLSELCGLPISDLLNATFYNLLKLFGANKEVQRARFMAGMLTEYYQFCPQCLAESVPYHRLLWRLTGITVCITHTSALIQECPSCHKSIRYHQVLQLNICPHCACALSIHQIKDCKQNLDWDQQKWLHGSYDTLLSAVDIRLDAPDAARRLLYLLGGCTDTFSRQDVENTLLDASILPSLLQHARDSLSQKRTLHLSTVLSTLYNIGSNVTEYLNGTVSQSFIDSLTSHKLPKIEQLSCQAPWCNGYHLPGTLIKTGTTIKRSNSGQILKYYVACTECHCEYAVDEHEMLKERTYFIEGYHLLSQVSTSIPGFKELARQAGMTVDKVRRCLAYFSTKESIDHMAGISCKVNEKLLKSMTEAVREGVPLQAIQKWGCWANYQQFLNYRFHSKVMCALFELKRPRPTQRADSTLNRDMVRSAVKDLLENDQEITLAAVCRIVGVCPETIRTWGFNQYIAEMKKRQKAFRLAKRRERLYEQIDQCFEQRAMEKVQSLWIYEEIGVCRTRLWRTSPDIASYITERVRSHNQIVEESYN